MKLSLVPLAGLILFTLAGCNSLPTQAPSGQGATDSEPAAIDVAPMEETPAMRAPSRAETAVASILLDANDAMRQGQYTLAAGRLERALRIEPGNPLLWHALAKVRLNQGRYSQAASLASKSNSLARGDQELRAKNQQIIDMARRSQQ